LFIQEGERTLNILSRLKKINYFIKGIPLNYSPSKIKNQIKLKLETINILLIRTAKAKIFTGTIKISTLENASLSKNVTIFGKKLKITKEINHNEENIQERNHITEERAINNDGNENQENGENLHSKERNPPLLGEDSVNLEEKENVNIESSSMSLTNDVHIEQVQPVGFETPKSLKRNRNFSPNEPQSKCIDLKESPKEVMNGDTCNSSLNDSFEKADEIAKDQSCDETQDNGEEIMKNGFNKEKKKMKKKKYKEKKKTMKSLEKQSNLKVEDVNQQNNLIIRLCRFGLSRDLNYLIDLIISKMKNGIIHAIKFDKYKGTNIYNGDVTLAIDIKDGKYFNDDKIMYKGKIFWTRIINEPNIIFTSDEILNIDTEEKKIHI